VRAPEPKLPALLQRAAQRMRLEGAELHHVPADGNCFFSALGLALQGFDRRRLWGPDKIMEVKGEMLALLRRLLHELWAARFERLPPETEALLHDDTLVQRLTTPFCWAEGSEALLAARLFRRNVKIFLLAQGERRASCVLDARPPPRGSGEPAVSLLLLLSKDGRSDHYAALEPHGSEELGLAIPIARDAPLWLLTALALASCSICCGAAHGCG